MHPPPRACLELHRRRIVMAGAAAIMVLSVLHLSTQWLRYHTGFTGLFGLIDLLAMQREANVPTFFASVLMLFSATLLGWNGVVARHRGNPFARHWFLLAAVLVAISFDESAGIHELTIIPLHCVMKDQASGLLYWPWVLPGMAFVILLALACLRWFIALPGQTRLLFAVSGTLFLTGAVAIEMAEARHVEIHGTDNFGYGIYVWFEETFELAGMLLFIDGLLHHIESIGGSIHLLVTLGGQSPPWESAGRAGPTPLQASAAADDDPSGPNARRLGA